MMSEKQREFWKNANSRWNIKDGATRSGKTYLDYFLIARRVLEARGDGLIMLIGNTRGTLERNILAPMRGIWGGQRVGNISADGSVVLFGKRCCTLGADRINQREKLQGTGIEYCYGDEITTWSREVFEMLKSRLDKPYSRFDGTCNPDSPDHWLLEFMQSGADVYRQSYTIYDNPFLDRSFVENLEKEYRGSVYFDRYILGKWTRAEGLVYPMFSRERHTFTKEPECGRYYISVDYGTVNPTSMGLWCVNGGKAWRIREYYYDSRKAVRRLTDDEYYDRLAVLAADYPIEYVVIDPSAASFTELVKQRGEFAVKKANNSVNDGIRYTAGLISAGRILIHRDCGGILREFGAYCWDEKATGDIVIKENDHAMDDMRYFTYTIFKRLFD